ncbi:hypothetical protein [Brevundimonas sp.]|uniref:hypothetical protein n=1 Tax=Brevundimonas sp. TaxID=1871086 RepID=UPI0025C2803A|nr:hypothetical protein [Brevundimonas sp.]
MTRKLCLLACLLPALAAAGPVSAQERTDPYWLAPAQEELASRLYPGFAGLLQTPGLARVKCWVEADGHPYLCDVVHESPRGLGFGSAARVIVASAQVGLGRVDGRPAPTSVETNIRFRVPDVERGWDGPEPTGVQLSLAREIVESMPDWSPRDRMEAMMDGLDFDRRAVVGPWIDELLPMDRETDLRIAALQMARLYSEAELRRVLAGERVDDRSPEALAAACPELTPGEELAMEELRRRYCGRYGCEVIGPDSVPG